MAQAIESEKVTNEKWDAETVEVINDGWRI